MRSHLRRPQIPFALLLIAAPLGLALPSCGGGTELQPEMPDPSVVDRSADDLGLPEPSGPLPSAEEATGGGDEDAEEAPVSADPPAPPPRVIAGERTAIEGDSPRLRVVAPRNWEMIRTGNAMLRIRLANWELEPEGRHVHVIIDNEPYIAVRDVSEPIDLNALVQEHLGHSLSEGTHVLRVFPSRGHHESVKSAGAFVAKVFHFRSRTADFEFDPDAPLLTYSRPKGCNVAGQRVLLDFYASNVELAEDGHRVRYSIDGEVEGEITSWVPHYIENLPLGEHRISLGLHDASGEPVAGPFNQTTRTIRVASSCD